MINHRKDVDLSKVEIIVLEGCGVRWHAYDSALQELATVKDWQEIKKIAASSGGGIPAFLTAIGNSPKKIHDITANLDFQELLDPVFLSKIPYFGYLFAFLFYHGFVQGNKTRNFAEKHLEKQGLSPYLTFEELAQLKETTRPDLKYLYLAAAVVTRGSQLIIFSHENTPHVRIADAMVAVLAYPGSGIPAKLLIDHKVESLFDGGVRDNFIVNHFIKTDSGKILGLKIDNYAEIFGFPHEYPTITQFFYSLVQDNHHDFIHDSHRYSLQLYDCGLTVTNIPLSKLQNFALHVSGTLPMANLIKNQGKDAIDETVIKKYDVNQSRLLSKRTNEYIRHLQEETLSLANIIAELSEWKKTNKAPFFYYCAVLCELRSHSGIVWNGGDYNTLTKLLKNSAEEFAETAEAHASDITDIVMAFLDDNEVERAYTFFKKLLDNSEVSAKLIDVDHTVILNKLNASWGFKNKKYQNQFRELLENLHDKKLALFPGAYEAHLVIQLNNAITAHQFDKALVMLTGNEFNCLRADLLADLYEVAQKQVEEMHLGQSQKLLKFLESKTGKSSPVTPVCYTKTFSSFFTTKQRAHQIKTFEFYLVGTLRFAHPTL